MPRSGSPPASSAAAGTPPTESPIVGAVLAWYAGAARELPWRAPTATPWAVLVSEIMLQQTPVARVLPTYADWLARWPTPTALAASAPGDAVRAWGRLGYPRRALRLHEAAAAIVSRHGGAVPDEVAALRALPGVGPYTAAAVAAFAFRQRQVVLDTNVRRVLARVQTGVAGAGAAVTVAEREVADETLPDDDERAATFSVALMEFGALICRARAPECAGCPLATRCAWRLAGYPAPVGPVRASQRYAGTDRQARGVVLAMLRSQAGPVRRSQLRTAWADDVQLARAIDGLVADGLIEPAGGRPHDRFQLPT
jgi:A/G-specific adenine glycosylase